jgi:hypothetical protein
MAVKMLTMVSWVMKPYVLASGYHISGELYQLHLHQNVGKSPQDHMCHNPEDHNQHTLAMVCIENMRLEHHI